MPIGIAAGTAAGAAGAAGPSPDQFAPNSIQPRTIQRRKNGSKPPPFRFPHLPSPQSLSITPSLIGKKWHPPKSAFRPTAGQTSYTTRISLLKRTRATKLLECEMKTEKAMERDRRVQGIRDRRKAKEEKERFERMAEKMHGRRVERRRRREKRNELLKSGK
jgi:rRNA-processing protein CGR1